MLNRCTGLNLYPGFESLPHRQPSPNARYARGYGWAKFRRGTSDPPHVPTELRVEPVGADGADAFAETFVRGYGTPGFFREWLARIPARERWYCFVAFDGEAPAAAGALYAGGSKPPLLPAARSQ